MGGEGALLMMRRTRSPLRSLMSQMSLLLDVKSKGANGQLESGDGGPPPSQSPAQHPLTAEGAGRCLSTRSRRRGLVDGAPEAPWPNKQRTSTACKALSLRPHLL